MIDIEKLKEKDLVKLHEQLKEKKQKFGLSEEEAKQYNTIKDILWMDYRI